jgi:hypothetical protein
MYKENNSKIENIERYKKSTSCSLCLTRLIKKLVHDPTRDDSGFIPAGFRLLKPIPTKKNHIG